MTIALHAALVPDPRAHPRVDVERILHPRSVAVFGASDSKDKFGGRIMSFLVQHGFAGEIYPINPRRPSTSSRRPRRPMWRFSRCPEARSWRAWPRPRQPALAAA